MGAVGSSSFFLPWSGLSSSRSRFLSSRYLNSQIDPTGFRHRSFGNKSVGCVLQANGYLTSCMVKLHSQYRCRLVRQTPCACSPAVDDSVLIVVMRECIVVFGLVSAPRPLLGVDCPFSTLLCPRILRAVCSGSGDFIFCLRRVSEEQLSGV